MAINVHFKSGNLKERGRVGGADAKIILKWVFSKYLVLKIANFMTLTKTL
jgi:hypothetical protein